MSDSLRPQELQHTRPPWPSPNPRVYPSPCPFSRWCHPTISYSVVPFSSHLQSFPASGSFSMCWLFASGSHSIGTSASLLPVNIQDWFPLGYTGLISLLSEGLSRVLQHHNSKTSILLYGPTLTSVHDYWKNHSFDYMDLCQQSDVSAF